MRILHILNTGKYSGAENVVCQIISMFKGNEDIEMAYCSLDGTVRHVLEEQNISFFPINEMSLVELKRVIETYHPDIIHAHDMKACYFASKVCGKIRLVAHIHNNSFDSRKISLKTIAFFFAATKAETIIWVSRSAFDEYVFRPFFVKKSVVLYNVISLEEIQKKMQLDKNDYDYDVVYVGRLTHVKNVPRLLQIVNLVSKSIPDIKVAIVGTGEEEDTLKQICTKLNLNNNIAFLGFQNNPAKIIYDSKVLVMTSYYEGTPMVALEAMSLGVPIVSTPTDGMNELVENGVNGFLSCNDNELAERIIDIIKNPELHLKLSLSQYEKSKSVNNLSNYKNELIKIYLGHI